MRGFFYGQSEYNMLKSTIRLTDYINVAKKNNFDFLTITDDNLAGAYKFYKECSSNNIKPVIGLEYSYLTEDQNLSKVLLYAKNNNGFKNLLKISSIERIKHTNALEDIKKYFDDLLIIYVFNDSFMERLVKKKEYQILNEFLNYLKECSKELYIGISYTNSLAKIDLNKEIKEYASMMGIDSIPVHQAKYLYNKDAIIYECLAYIGGKKDKINELDDYSFEENPLDDSLVDKLVSEINVDIYNDKILLPKYPNTKGNSSKDYLKALCYKGLSKRGLGGDMYINRLNYELDVINNMGYNDYFLIVWDFIKYAKTNGILVGPGRGSAAGSLVSYSLGISDVNPLPYGLLFERFLNPERVSMPDIDTDFPDVSRDKVIDYVKELYGKRHVCNISAFGTFQEKSAIRELARVTKMEAGRAEKIIDMVSEEGFDSLIKKYEGTEMHTFLYVAKGLVGLPKHISTHAAGIVLSYQPLDEIIPLQDGLGGLYQSQMEASDLEKIGLLKMDFLALRNLTMISDMIKEIPGFDFKRLREIPLNDPKTFKLLCKADTLGVFQLESDGIRNVLKKLKPTTFMDLVAVLALYRPGPMDNIDLYISNKYSNRIVYPHPSLEPILKETYGIIVYQEQIMQIAQLVAGYSLGEADVLRRAISKKKEDMLVKIEDDFIKRSLERGYSNKTAKDIYDLIYKFANYGFNKSHSVAYGLVAYQMAYLKANYFSVFMANILNNTISSKNMLIDYIKYAKNHGLKVLKPSINISTNKFVSHRDGIYMPFNTIFTIGETVAKTITDERNAHGLYLGFDNFKERVKPSSDVLTALIFAGTFDFFGKSKKSLNDFSSAEDELFLKYMNNVVISNEEYPFDYLKEMELKYLGYNFEFNLFNDSKNLYARYNAKALRLMHINERSYTIIEFRTIKEIKTKTGKKMLVGNISDNDNDVRFVMFDNCYLQVGMPQANHLYLVYGYLEYDKNKELSFVIQNASLIK